MTKLFPILLITLDILSSLVYAVYGDWRKCIYWLAAAILSICVTI